MATAIIKEVNVDVYDRKLIIVNAKQYDKSVRYILVSCYNQGTFLPISSTSQKAYIRYKKPDGYCVFNDCTIMGNGKVQFELTEQMLTADGNAYADLVIVNVSTEGVNENLGEFNVDVGSIFSTMTFCIKVLESSCNCWDIESSDEFVALNNLMIQAQKNYYDVMNACKVSENNMTGMFNRLGGVFAPQGTITFSQLSSVQKVAGYVYHISDEFTTDSTFKCGAGVYFKPGTTIYRTVDGYWDYFIGENLYVTDDNNGNVTISLKLTGY